MGSDRDFKIGLGRLQQFHHTSQSCIDTNAPLVIDHRKTDNPYHDSLSLMTAVETVAWMKEKKYQGYDNDDPRKYTLTTPITGFNSINRVWKSTPSSKRIVEDIKEIAETYRIIIEAGGVLCDRDQNIGGNRGHRRGNWGGRRQKGIFTKKNRNKKEFPVDGIVAIKKLCHASPE